MAHSRFAPSATEREYSCPASFLLSERLPDVQTFDAAHGTAAHHIGQLCLANGHDTELYAACVVAVGLHGECRFVTENHPPREDEMAFEVDDEMMVAVQEYVDWCRQLPGEHFVEVRVEHTRWCPDRDEFGDPLGPQFGTSDHVACEPEILTVTDLKYGKGVKVFAFENKQAIKYALGVYDEYNWAYNFKKVRIRISQPRLDHADVWELTVEELLEWGARIKKRLELVFVPDPPFGPSEKACKFCKAGARCKALADHIQNTRAMLFDDETQTFVEDPALLTNEELAEAWRLAPLFQIRFDAIVRELMTSLGDGADVPGLKLVESSTHRRWNDEAKAREFLRSKGIPADKLVKKKFVSPNQAEKLLAKDLRKELDGLWHKPKGGPCIVDAEDPREPYTGDGAHMGVFEDEDFDDGFNS